jgi:hypothetical protein
MSLVVALYAIKVTSYGFDEVYAHCFPYSWLAGLPVTGIYSYKTFGLVGC